MTLKEIFEVAAGGSSGAANIGAFCGRLFGSGVNIKRYIPDPDGDIPVIEYKRKSKQKADEKQDEN